MSEAHITFVKSTATPKSRQGLQAIEGLATTTGLFICHHGSVYCHRIRGKADIDPFHLSK